MANRYHHNGVQDILINHMDDRPIEMTRPKGAMPFASGQFSQSAAGSETPGRDGDSVDALTDSHGSSPDPAL